MRFVNPSYFGLGSGLSDEDSTHKLLSHLGFIRHDLKQVKHPQITRMITRHRDGKNREAKYLNTGKPPSGLAHDLCAKGGGCALFPALMISVAISLVY